MFRMALNPLWVPIWSKYINFKGNTVVSIADLIDYWQAHFAGGAERPLFMFLNLMQSHLPFQPPQDYVDQVAPKLRHDRHAYAFMGRFNADGAAWASPPDPSLEDWQQQVLSDFYDAEIAYQDDHLGRLLTYLETSGELDNTLVLIAADHGESLGDHNLIGHGFNVPPPLAADDPNANVGGLTLLNAVRGEDGEGEIAFTEAIPPTTFLHVIEHRNPAIIDRMRLGLTRRGVYAGDHKFVLAGNMPEALYNVAQDASEEHNLVREQPALVAELAQRMSSFIQQAERRRGGAAMQSEVSDEVMEQLRALGYVD
jgi:arylsulfatase A-like enzyme